MNDSNKNTIVKNNESESNLINIKNPKLTNSKDINNIDNIIENSNIVRNIINSKSLKNGNKNKVKEITRNQQNAYLEVRKKNIFNYLNSKIFKNQNKNNNIKRQNFNYSPNPDQNDMNNSFNKINSEINPVVNNINFEKVKVKFNHKDILNKKINTEILNGTDTKNNTITYDENINNLKDELLKSIRKEKNDADKYEIPREHSY